jgi:hypothetical protein
VPRIIGLRVCGATTGSMIATLVLAASSAPQAGFAEPATSAAQLIAQARSGRPDVPRVELAARLKAAGLQATLDYALMRDNAARELKGRPDGTGAVSAAELTAADAAIAAQVAILQDTAQPPQTLADIAQLPGRPQIPGLAIVYLNPLGDPGDANRWQNILAHQTEGPPGSGRAAALAQAANPTKRGVTVWVETDGTTTGRHRSARSRPTATAPIATTTNTSTIPRPSTRWSRPTPSVWSSSATTPMSPSR